LYLSGYVEALGACVKIDTSPYSSTNFSSQLSLESIGLASSEQLLQWMEAFLLNWSCHWDGLVALSLLFVALYIPVGWYVACKLPQPMESWVIA
jgi:hypothetical protein